MFYGPHMTIAPDVKKYIAIGVLLASFLASYSIVTHAQSEGAVAGSVNVEATAAASAGITFPIPELGNCTDKSACKAYCDDAAHIDACASFAQVHGLMNKSEVDRAQKFKKDLQANGGPGGCKSPAECRAFCDILVNIDVCVKFAEAHGATGRDVAIGKSVSAFIKSGGTMPGGCTTKDACREYCSDFGHAEECAAFARKAGIAQQGGDANGAPQKFLDAVKNGQTPGGCTSKDACELYCKGDAHRDECVVFAEKAGFIKPGEGERLRQGGFAGPGGCTSQEACSAYCNDQAHHDECYAFAEAHGFIKKDDIQRAKEGVVSLKVGIEHASPEVASCIRSMMGESVIEDIQSGKLTPGPDIGERVRGCFEKFGKKADPADFFKKAPAAVVSCMKEKLGSVFDTLQSGQAQPTAEMGDTLRVCYQVQELNFNAGNGKGEGMGGMMRPANPAQFLQSAPPEVVSCLKEKLGDKFQAVQNGDTNGIGEELGEKMKACFQSFRPGEHMMNRPNEGRDMMGGGTGMNAGPQGKDNMAGTGIPPNIPPQVAECVKSSGVTFDTTRDLSQNQAAKDVISACFQKARIQIQGGSNNPGSLQMTGERGNMVNMCVVKMMEYARASGQPANEESIRRECADEMNRQLPPPTGGPDPRKGMMPSEPLVRPQGDPIADMVVQCVKEMMANGATNTADAKMQCIQKLRVDVPSGQPGMMPPSDGMMQMRGGPAQPPPAN